MDPHRFGALDPDPEPQRDKQARSGSALIEQLPYGTGCGPGFRWGRGRGGGEIRILECHSQRTPVKEKKLRGRLESLS
jgi:hypothetical protein